jgi:hypothetical protein
LNPPGSALRLGPFGLQAPQLLRAGIGVAACSIYVQSFLEVRPSGNFAELDALRLVGFEYYDLC